MASSFCGVIVGCDKNQQWLLPWFWDHYFLHNNYPVTFMDFGMTQQAKRWCEQRGECIKAEGLLLKPVPKDIAKDWESSLGNDFWRSRASWFCKVRACHLSSFETSLWIDLDCEVKGSIEPLFHSLSLGGDFAIAQEHPLFQTNLRERNRLLEGQVSYSSGVMAFKKNSKVVSLWLKESLHSNHLYKGDQDALSFVIHKHRPHLIELPLDYNWPVSRGENPEALILHYDSGPGKVLILQNLKKELASLVKSLSSEALAEV